MLLKPEFNRADIPGVVNEITASKADQYSDPVALAEALANRIFFGTRESSGEELEALKSIKSNDLEEFYKKHFIPQNVTLAIVGSYDEKEITGTIANNLKNWKQGKEIQQYKSGNEALAPGIYFIPRNESVQSFIMFTKKAVPFHLQIRAPEYTY